MLAGNEAAYVTYLEKKVADQEAAAAATVAAAAAEKASDMAKAVIAAIKAKPHRSPAVMTPFDQPAAPELVISGGIICW